MMTCTFVVVPGSTRPCMARNPGQIVRSGGNNAVHKKKLTELGRTTYFLGVVVFTCKEEGGKRGSAGAAVEEALWGRACPAYLERNPLSSRIVYCDRRWQLLVHLNCTRGRERAQNMIPISAGSGQQPTPDDKPADDTHSGTSGQWV